MLEDSQSWDVNLHGHGHWKFHSYEGDKTPMVFFLYFYTGACYIFAFTASGKWGFLRDKQLHVFILGALWGSFEHFIGTCFKSSDPHGTSFVYF